MSVEDVDRWTITIDGGMGVHPARRRHHQTRPGALEPAARGIAEGCLGKVRSRDTLTHGVSSQVTNVSHAVSASMSRCRGFAIRSAP